MADVMDRKSLTTIRLAQQLYDPARSLLLLAMIATAV